MTSITLKLIGENSPDRPHLEAINQEAFPAWERLEGDEIFTLARETDTDVLGLYDGDALVGFIVMVKNQTSGYLFFLATDQHSRGLGYGTAALEAVFRRYEHLQICLDFEPVDEKAENYDQRVRRRAFYLRNGFQETGLYTRTYGQAFQLVCHGGPLDRAGMDDLLGKVHALFPAFSERLWDEPD